VAWLCKGEILYPENIDNDPAPLERGDI
jgi:hypothetical protein